MDFLRVGLMSQRHRRMTVPAQLGVKIIAATADIARAGDGVRHQPIRIHFQQAVGSHARASSGCSAKACSEGWYSVALVSPLTGVLLLLWGLLSSPLMWATSQNPKAQRNPILCLRASGV